MARNNTRAQLLAAALAFSALLLPVVSAPAASAPGSPTPAPQSEKLLKTNFVVVQMLYQSIQVRSLTDMREIHTFSYSPELRDKMQKIFNAGGYQYGDKVVVWYRSGENVALKIKGKPSKPK
jgi:hypothetical protein